jgi:ABC-type transport system substrate-binding protein
MYILDLNNNQTLPDGTNNPGGDADFRHAIWHLIDREYIATSIFQGMGAALYGPIAGAAPAAWRNPAVVGAHPYDLAEARSILDAAGYTINLQTNKRIDPVTGLDMNLDLYGRSDHPYRRDAMVWFAAQLDAVNVGYTLFLVPSSTTSLVVMTNKDFFAYTGGWGLGVDVPDTCYGLFHSMFYWHPGKPPNYGHYSDPISDALLEAAEYSGSASEAITAIQQWQMRYIDPEWVPAPAMVSNLIFHAHRKQYGHWAGEEAFWDMQWSDIFNRPGVGIGAYNSFWTFMDMQPEPLDGTGHPNDMPGNWKIRWGWKVSGWDILNPVYGSWVWDWAIMNWIYDTWTGINPIVTTEDKPWMAYQFDFGLWDNPDNPAFPKSSYVTIKMRDDVYWHDGQKMTIEDFRWMIGTEPGDLISIINDRGLELPWWYSSIADVHDVHVLDSYTLLAAYHLCRSTSGNQYLTTC